MRAASVLAISLLTFACSNNDEEPPPAPPLFEDTGAVSDTTVPFDGVDLDVVLDVSDAPSTCSDGAPAPSGKLTCPTGAVTDYPKAGSACGPGTGSCTYVQPCGLDKWNCCGTWERTVSEVPACSLCPATEPTSGSACTKENLLCAFAKAGGKYCEWAETYCKDGKWAISARTCDAACPKDAPKTGDACDATASGAFCIWASPCHSQAYGYCSASKWTVTSPCP